MSHGPGFGQQIDPQHRAFIPPRWVSFVLGIVGAVVLAALVVYVLFG